MPGGEKCGVRSFHTFVEDLKNRGFTVKFDSSLKGRSGAIHQIDMMAENLEGRKIVVMEKSGNEASVDIIRLFAISLDCEAEAYYIVDGDLDEKSRMLVEFYKITLLTS